MKRPKPSISFVCNCCGSSYPRWIGKCSKCKSWNTIEQTTGLSKKQKNTSIALGSIREEHRQRLHSGIEELDRVLGGGIVSGSTILIAGEPGIGKSTLLMQALEGLRQKGHRVMYVSGEESLHQLFSRATRLRLKEMDGIRVLVHSELEVIEEVFRSEKPNIAVIDSIQTLRSPEIETLAGSLSQVRGTALQLIHCAKELNIALFLVGHVTKDGAIAGPKVLEHLVDTVLNFEGDQNHDFRMIRSIKNRFGKSQEIGVFEMMQEGLVQLPDPSSFFLSQRKNHVPGSSVTASAQGSRPMLVEVQALVASSQYSSPRRVASGLDVNRLNILLAVLHRRAGVQVLDNDVFVSIAGGAHIEEYSVDLALGLAIVSSLREKPLHPNMVIIGEVGLSGEIRSVPKLSIRIQESQKLGFQKIMLPRSCVRSLTIDTEIELIPVDHMNEALDIGIT